MSQYVAFRESRPVAVWRVDDGDNIRCTDVRDTSPQVLGDTYDSRCGYCWLGGPHTRQFHDQAIQEPSL